MSVDLDFRPTSYADFDDPVALAVNGIAGQRRREMVRDMLGAEGEQRDRYDAVLGSVEPAILEERAAPGFTATLTSAWGPSWMGGEYLPRLKRNEVEIARIILNSTTMDVFSLRARWTGGRYHYRMVDENASWILLRRKTSLKPLTLAQVVDVLDHTGGDLGAEGQLLLERWWNRQWKNGYEPFECTDFARVESEIYPDLDLYYRLRASDWRQERYDEQEAAED